MLRKQKFTDQQYLEQYNKGLNDVEISYILKVDTGAILIRRWKMNLLPNYRPAKNTVTNPKQHLHEYERTRYQIHKPIHKRYAQQHKKEHTENSRKSRRMHPERTRAIQKNATRKTKNKSEHAHALNINKHILETQRTLQTISKHKLNHNLNKRNTLTKRTKPTLNQQHNNKRH
jgi:hypothetical protein